MFRKQSIFLSHVLQVYMYYRGVQAKTQSKTNMSIVKMFPCINTVVPSIYSSYNTTQHSFTIVFSYLQVLMKVGIIRK